MTKIKINDRWYEPTLPYEVESDGHTTQIRPKFAGTGTFVQELVDKCPRCGRGGWQQVVYHSFGEAINAGLFVEASAP